MWSTSDPVSSLGLSLAVLLLAAKVGGDLASRLRQAPVLGEILGGLLLGMLPFGWSQHIRSDASVDMIGRLGVLILLFEVGLDSTVRDVMKVGVASTRVALFGTVCTWIAGWIAARWAMPHASGVTDLFVASSLTATSIGVSARVMKDSSRSGTREAHVILGAAVLDDVFALVVLAVVTAAVVRTGDRNVTFWSVGCMVGRVVGFLAGALLMGVTLSPWLFRASFRLRSDGALLATGLAFCFVLAWASDLAGLAPLVGAFAAGLILEDSHSAAFVARGERSLRERMEPISSWLVPIFFVLVGMRADCRALAHVESCSVVLALTLAAILGKMACAAGAPANVDRISVAIAMWPRGEVTLVFATLGATLYVGGHPLLDATQYSALVAVVVLTTLAAPPALRYWWAHAANG